MKKVKNINRAVKSTYKNSQVVKGVIEGNRNGYAFLIRDDGGEDIFIPANALNGALHKDKVLVGIAVQDVQVIDGFDKADRYNGRDNPGRQARRNAAMQSRRGEGRRFKNKIEGKVIDILERGLKNIVGVLEIYGDKLAYVVADEGASVPEVYVPIKTIQNARHGQKVVVKVTDFEYPLKGEIIEVLGDAGDPQTEVLAITRSFGFDKGFPKKVLKQAEQAEDDDIEKVAMSKKRVDHRDLLTVTIDGEDAKDFDDAVSLVKQKDGYRLYVHIADVAHYVRHKSILDEQAFERGTSVYFPGYVLPMLPEVLSNGVCSLKEGEDRLAVTVEVFVNFGGAVLDFRVYESIIKSDMRMTYSLVTNILEGEDFEITNNEKRITNNEKRITNNCDVDDKKMSEISRMLFDMLGLRDALYKKRVKRGAIFFETKESQITVDPKGRVLDVKPYVLTISNSIIEEFMLIANECVAKWLRDNGHAAVFRIHEKPTEEKIETFKLFMQGLGLCASMPQEIQAKKASASANNKADRQAKKASASANSRADKSTKGVRGKADKYQKGEKVQADKQAGGIYIKLEKPQDFQKVLSHVEGTRYEVIVNRVMLRAMQKAKYDAENKGHFGLAAKHYCHFTSPIRRYPDLVTHRVVKAVLASEGTESDKEKDNISSNMQGGKVDKKLDSKPNKVDKKLDSKPNKVDKKLDSKSNKADSLAKVIVDGDKSPSKSFCYDAAVQSSERERAADSAERKCDDYYKAYYMEERQGEEYMGIISGVTAFGIFVELENTVEGLVRLEWLPKDNYSYIENKYTLKGKKYSYSLGEIVKVRVESADRAAGQVNFSLVE